MTYIWIVNERLDDQEARIALLEIIVAKLLGFSIFAFAFILSSIIASTSTGRQVTSITLYIISLIIITGLIAIF